MTRFRAVLAACLGLSVAVAACDESFDPTAPSEFAFSVFGYLDASADTQWIRVMPIRPLGTTSPGPLAATVTLEHLGTGRIVQLEDSVFEFSSTSHFDPAAEGVLYVHNFWTAEAIEPGAAYRFSVTSEGEEPAEAVVEIPHDYAVEIAISQTPQGGDDQLQITGVKHLPFLIQHAYYFDDCGSDLRRFRWEGLSADDETYLITMQKQSVPSRAGCGLPRVESRHLQIVGSEAVWPSGGYSPDALDDFGLTSNVSNAVGFLGGVLSKVIPYEDCTFQSEGAPIPPTCQLSYGPEKATVSGVVSDSVYRCVGPLDSVTIRLTELDRDPARVRNVVSTRAGTFAIGALQPGIPHVVWAHAPPVVIDSEWVASMFQWRYTEWWDLHSVHTDTLTFTPGQRLEYDIHLERFLPCKAGTLIGTVTEGRCGDGPIDSATVQLTELNVQPGVTPRTITGHTDSNGEFLITGLRPLLHLLQVRVPDVVVDSVYNPETGVWDPVLENIYSDHTDYMEFLPDQVVKYDVLLGRLTPCSEPPPGGQ